MLGVVKRLALISCLVAVSSFAAADEAAYRAFTPPPPLVLAAPTTTSEACADAGPAERERERAALDAALRKKGGYVLALQTFGEYLDHDPKDIGSIVRGRSGERFLVIGSLSCGQRLPVFAIDTAGAVFQPTPIVKARSTRSLAECEPECGGCGHSMPPERIVAEVPAGAHLDPKGTRDVEVPMEIRVRVVPSKRRCVPRP
jgi:hypothetical protein